MPTYQQRFGHKPAPKHDPAIITPKPKKRSQVAQHLGGTVVPAGARGPVRSKPAPKAHGGGGGLARLPQTPADLQKQVRARVSAPATPGKYVDPHNLRRGISHATGIDVQIFSHPLRTIGRERSQAAALGRQYQAGKVSGAQALGTIGIFPGGGRIPGLGRSAAKVADSPIVDQALKIRPELDPAFIREHPTAAHGVVSVESFKSRAAEFTGPARKELLKKAKGQEHLLQQHYAEWRRSGPKTTARDLPAAAEQAQQPLGPLTRTQSEKAAHQAMQEEVLPAGKRAAAAQRKAIREQRPERTAKAIEAERKAGGGEAGLEAANAALRGEFDKPVFDLLRSGKFNKEDIAGFMRKVDKHTFSANPDLNFYKRRNLKQAIKNAYEYGDAPRKHENELLAEVFGPRAVAPSRGIGQKLLDVGNIPRAFQTTLDVSFLARQAALVAASRPGIFAKGIAPTFKSLLREGKYEEVNHIIRSDPLYEQAVKDGVAFSDVGGDIRTHEEAFASNYAEKMTGGKHSPIRASGRAYSAAGNFYRMAMYRHLIEAADSGKKGILGGVSDIENPAVRRKMAETANTLTGRGSGGEKWEKAAPFLNNFLFSPRFLRARINMLNPHWYTKLDPVSRREAFRAIVRMAGSMAVILEAAHYAGARVGTDPRSADFGKIRFGNTRVDIGGGFLPYIRLAAQEATQTAISSTTGKPMKLGQGFGAPTGLDIGLRFLEGKASPSASMGLDVLRGKTFTGTPLSWDLKSVKYEAFNKGVPLVVQDAIDAQQSHGSAPLTAGLYGLSALGFGVQTYGPRAKKPKHYGGRGGGGSSNPYLGGSSGSSNPYLPSSGSSSNPYLP